MVVFTCNNCNEAVQKPKVMKHISYNCKKKYAIVSLCCMDCLKDFNSETYADHTKCVTELERYSGSNFVPKSSSDKGERKQNEWINIVRSVLSQPTLSKEEKQLLQAMSHYENVPRKKAKFLNFIRNSVKHIRVFPSVVNSVFELLEKEFKSSAMVNPSPDKTKSINENSNGSKEVSRSEERKENDKWESALSKKDWETTSKRKSENEDILSQNLKSDEAVSKKKKKREDNDNVMSENKECERIEKEDQHSIVNIDVSKKKKKKKKNSGENEIAVFENTGFETIAKKKLKNDNVENQGLNSDSAVLKKKRKNVEGDVVTAENKARERITKTKLEKGDVENLDLQSDEAVPKKKKRRTENDTTVFKNEECEKIAKKKLKNGNVEIQDLQSDKAVLKKRKKEKNGIEESENVRDVSVNAEQLVKFNWKEVIESMLSKTLNRELTVKKMKKKVAKKYRQFYGDDKSFEDIGKTFDKKIKKMSNIDVDENRIRLRE